MTPAFVLPATHAGLPLLPISAVVLGGVLAWKLWQQQNHYKKQQAALNEELEALKDQLNDRQAQTTTQQKNQEQAPQAKSTKSQSTHQSTNESIEQIAKPSSANHGLFEQLIDDNIALRQAD